MDGIVISSPANPRVKAILSLRRRRDRDLAGATLLEGRDELQLAMDSGVKVRTLVGCPDLMPDPAVWDAVTSEAVGRSGAEVLRLSRAAFDRLAYREHPDGVLAVVDAPPADLSRVFGRLTPLPGDPAAGPLVVVCEAVEKPGNLGALLRTADAAGVAAVLAADPATDWGNPNVVRASKGTVFSLPVASATTDDILGALGHAGFRLVATTPDGDCELTEADLTGPVAVAVGAENVGLSGEMLAAAAVRVRIPMCGRVNSLNVATAGAIVVYEAVRQRRGGPSHTS